MSYAPDKHHRHSLRLKGYNYASRGAYFVTICVQNRQCLLGDIIDGELRSNDAGRMVEATWAALPQRFPATELDAFVVMPNHVHGIIALPGADRAPARTPTTLGAIIQAFKSITTHAYIHGIHSEGWMPFERRLWQRNYWEHIVRGETELDRLREYIDTNPARWTADQLHPAAPTYPAL